MLKKKDKNGNDIFKTRFKLEMYNITDANKFKSICSDKNYDNSPSENENCIQIKISYKQID